MLGDCEKMVVISSTNNEWPQIDDQKGLMASNPRVAMDQKPINQDQTIQQQQQQQQALKCPRCDSSNTKFCYYNNYSLSQPRHFCKACKRYWTRGGTLRNVPVGGGCRKNKRVKSRPSSSINDAPSSSSSISTSTSTVDPRIMNHHQPHIDVILSSSSNHIGNPNLLYGLPTNPYPSFNSRVSSLINPLGLGFSTGLDDDYRSGFNSNSLLSSSYSMFGSSSSSSTTTSSSMASIIASSLQQQKYTSSGFHGLIGAYENLQMAGPGEGGGVVMNQTDQMINGSSDPSLYWNSTNVGAWLDPTNLGPSVPSLI